MSQNHGWIALYRQLQDHWLWKDRRVFSRAEAWIDILMQVQHDPETVEHMLGSVPVSCGRGQSIKSLDTWASRWGWTKSATRRFLSLLKKCGNIDTENVTKTTRITVCNYDRYQTPRNANETQVKRKRNALETHLTPDNNVNNANNGKNEKKTPKEALSQTPRRTAYDLRGFKRFWTAYPKHQRKVGKRQCFELWKRRNLEAQTDLIIGWLNQAKRSDDWRRGYMPMPQTWLNQEPWSEGDGMTPDQIRAEKIQRERDAAQCQLAVDLAEKKDAEADFNARNAWWATVPIPQKRKWIQQHMNETLAKNIEWAKHSSGVAPQGDKT